jgi:glucose-1-phosphate thymidylyltransferase
MSTIIGILPAAGTGSRLEPFRYAKELLPISYRWSDDGMAVLPSLAIEHGLEAMMQAGVSLCNVVVSESKPELIRYVGDGQRWGVHVSFVVQAKPAGLAHAIAQGCKWATQLKLGCCMALPDTVFEPREALRGVIHELTSTDSDLVLGVFATEFPHDLGPVRVRDEGTVERVYDKPKHTDLRNTWAIAAWTPHFSEFLLQQVAALGEADANLGHIFDAAIRFGFRVRAVEFQGFFYDLGTPRGLAHYFEASARNGPQREIFGRFGPRLGVPSAETTANGSRQIPDEQCSAVAHPVSCPERARSHLLVSLNDRSWGRSEVALHVGQQLQKVGDTVRFVVPSWILPLFENTGFQVERIPEHASQLTRLLLDSVCRRYRPDSIIYFDFFNCTNYLTRIGVHDCSFLLHYDSATITLDTWDFRRTGHIVDIIGGQYQSLVNGDIEQRISEFESIPDRLIPVPLTSLDGPQKFRWLPSTEYYRSQDRRDKWSFAKSQRLVLFCTSRWQHSVSANPAMQRLAELLPELLAAYIRRTHPSIHLVHVGPSPYRLDAILGTRYRWLPPMSSSDFEELLMQVDLLISPNISSTVIGKAFQHKVPVLVVGNSKLWQDANEVNVLLGSQLSEDVLPLVLRALPIYPFWLWPLGYHAFLSALLPDNAYGHAFTTVELLHQRSFAESIEGLLFDNSRRSQAIRKQVMYSSRVSLLPTAAELVQTCVS